MTETQKDNLYGVVAALIAIPGGLLAVHLVAWGLHAAIEHFAR